jgi:pyruvate dehydrogenase E1 component alpha subunit
VDAAELIEFEVEVARRFEAKEIRGPIHLCSEGQAAPLIEIFRGIKRTDWVLSTWRSHWHALLHGIPRDLVMAEIVAGRSMALHFPEHRFMTSAIMGGMLPIACGLAAAGETVWCFVGDMCAMTGAFNDAYLYAQGHDLPVRFVIEDNGLSVNTPTKKVWDDHKPQVATYKFREYKYERITNHSGTNTYVAF